MSSIEQIKITDLRSHMQIEWPNGDVHTWVPKNSDSWHAFLNRVADQVPMCYSIKPLVSSAGALQYDFEGLVAFCDLHGVEIAYGKGVWFCSKGEALIATNSDLETMLAVVTKELSK